MDKPKNKISEKIEKSHGIRIAIALLFTIGLVWFFIPEQKEYDELAQLAKKGDWEKLVETSDDYLKKEQTPKAFYYKAKGHFQLFRNSKKREGEVTELTNALTVIKSSLDLFPDNFQTEYKFAMRPIINGAQHYFHYLKLKGDTTNVDMLGKHVNGLFEIYEQTDVEKMRSDIVKRAYELIGSAYIPGGVSPAQGFDCSGFTRYLFKEQGLVLPHGAFLQIASGVEVEKKEAQSSDLIFFTSDTLVTHVGVVVGRNANGLVMIHASSVGVVETDEGSNEWKDYWGKKVVICKRLLVE
jgi:cell wall-associated NlpC family hydrolase